jgi:hypothetical protein
VSHGAKVAKNEKHIENTQLANEQNHAMMLERKVKTQHDEFLFQSSKQNVIRQYLMELIFFAFLHFSTW